MPSIQRIYNWLKRTVGGDGADDLDTPRDTPVPKPTQRPSGFSVWRKRYTETNDNILLPGESIGALRSRLSTIWNALPDETKEHYNAQALANPSTEDDGEEAADTVADAPPNVLTAFERGR